MDNGRCMPGLLNAGRFCYGRDRFYPGKKCRKHRYEEHDGLRYRFHRLFPHWLRADVRSGQRNHRFIRFLRPLRAGSFSAGRHRTRPSHRRIYDFPHGILRHIRYHRFRRYGRTDKICRLSGIQRLHQYFHLPGDRSLDLGRRLAVFHRIP